MALEAGRSVRWVADVLGHADPALTLRVYTHAVRAEEVDLSFADFARAPASRAGLTDGSERHYTAPRLGKGSDAVTDEDQDGTVTASDFADFAAGKVVAQGRIELPTPAFSVRCSTN